MLQYVEGASVSGLYAVRSLGIDASNGYEVFLTKDGRADLCLEAGGYGVHGGYATQIEFHDL